MMSKRDRSPEPTQDEVNYRLLYEGSQASLADMATKQVAAAARTNKLRAAILEQMRRKFPSQFLKAEKYNGRRLETLGDEALIAYLARFLEITDAADHLDEGSLPPRDDSSLINLRAALAEAGLGVPASAQSVEEITQALRAKSIRNFNPAPTTQGVRGNPFPSLTPAHLHPSESADAVLIDILGGPTAPSSDLRIASEDKNRHSPDAVGKTELTPIAVPGTPPVQSDLKDTSSDAQTLTPIPGGWGAPTSKPSEGALPTAPAPIWPTTTEEPPAATQTTEVEVKDPVLDRAAAMLESGVVDTKTRTPARAPEMPLRPELGITPDGSGRGKRVASKTSRVSATAPADEATFDLAPESLTAQIVTDKSVNTRIQAMVAAGVPTFTSSLLPLAGSAAALQSWEESLRADDNAQLRFVPPRKRHASLGALVYPTEQELFLPEVRLKPWPTLVKRYHGAKLFELGILMGYIGKDVISIDCEDHVLVIRVKEPRGAAGLVVVLEPDLSISSATRVQAAKAITTLSKERLTVLAVMTTNEPAYLEISDLVSSLLRDEKLAFSCPVVAAKSWEYTQSKGAKVEPLLCN